MSRASLIIGAPLDGSGTGRGEVRAPARLRAAGLAARLGAQDFGDLAIAIDDPARDPGTGIIGYRRLVAASRTLRDAVGSALAAGWRPVVLGGCCSVLPGAVAGARRHLGPIGLAFVDGHLDLFDGRTSRTGEIAGMDLAIVLGHGPADLVDLAGEAPIVDTEDVVAIGDADHARRVAFRAPGPDEIAPGLRVIDAAAVRHAGAIPVTGPFWLHLDVDAVDGAHMPAVSFPAATGLSWDDVAAILRPLLAAPDLVGITVAGYNADLDETGELAARIVDALTI